MKPFNNNFINEEKDEPVSFIMNSNSSLKNINTNNNIIDNIEERNLENSSISDKSNEYNNKNEKNENTEIIEKVNVKGTKKR